MERGVGRDGLVERDLRVVGGQREPFQGGEEFGGGRGGAEDPAAGSGAAGPRGGGGLGERVGGPYGRVLVVGGPGVRRAAPQFLGDAPRRGRGLLRVFLVLFGGQERAEQGRAGAQFVQGAGVDDPAAVHERDPVGQLQGGLAVGDEDGGGAASGPGQGGVDLGLGPGVDRGGGVVEDQDLGVGEQGAGERDPLALAAGERQALLADDRVVALGEPVDERVGAGEAGGGPYLLVARVRASVGDVGPYGVGEQQALLEDEADAGAQGGQGQVADVVPADPDRARRRVVEARQERDGGGLAAARRADERERLARAHVQAEAVEEGVAVAVGEGHVVPDEGRGAGGRFGSAGRGSVRQVGGPRRVRDPRFLVDHLEDPLRARPGLLPDGEQGRHLADRGDEGAEVGGEGEEGAERDPAVERQPAAEREDRDLAEGGDGLEGRVVAAGEGDDPQPGGEEAAHAPLQARQFALLLAEALDDPDPGDRGLDGGGDLGRLLLGVPVRGEEGAPAAQGDQPQERADDQGDDGEQRREPRHEDQRDAEHQGVAGHVGQELQQRLDEGDVGDGPAHHLAGAQVVLLGAVQAQQGREGVVAQVVLDAEGEPSGAVAADEAPGEADGADAGEQQDPGREGGGRGAGDAVHDVAEQEGQRGGGDGGHGGGAEGEQEVGAAAERVPAEAAGPAGPRRLDVLAGGTVAHRASTSPAPRWPPSCPAASCPWLSKRRLAGRGRP